ncbi:MAG: hypothetical protein AB4911_02435 [Oscillochloridaceae bacterium umkhey_bin13]
MPSIQFERGKIANTPYGQQIFGGWRNRLRATLPADIVATAEDRGRQLDLWATVEALRHELAALTLGGGGGLKSAMP